MSSLGPTPLSGKTVLVTRARHQVVELCSLLQALQAKTIHLPLLHFKPLPHGLDEIIAAANRFDWIVFVSQNAVDFAAEIFAQNKMTIEDLLTEGGRLAAIGSRTSRKMADAFETSDIFFAAKAVAESFATQFNSEHPQPGSVLLIRGEEGRDVIERELSAAGKTVTKAAVYKTIPAVNPPGEIAEVRRLLDTGAMDAITLTSSLAARFLSDIFSVEELAKTRIVAIGPVTGATCVELFGRVDAIADEHDQFGLIAALISLKYDNNAS